ncbi:hypothetical protein K438DRAFT_1051589 [Mycena galopus ATCC 62051]|nr:hypothetical protein K438DRAFT_1051589 [Mycena galopus ATCC 62051]
MKITAPHPTRSGERFFPAACPLFWLRPAMTATDLVDCVSTELLGSSLSFVSATLFLFDYCITFLDELRFVWFQRHSTSTILFWVARYAGMASAIVTLIQTPTTSLILANMSTALRVIAIVAAEVRTWAIWERKRYILVFLCLVSAAALAGNAILIIRGVNGTHAQSSDGDYSVIVDTSSQAYLIPYVVVIAYETITMTLSAARILKWRSQINPSTQTALLDTLWNDGLMYFTWMITLGIANILMILHGSVAVRTGGAHILSTRIILHLAKLGGTRRYQNRATSSATVSSLFTPTTLMMTSADESSFWGLDT